MTRRRQEDSDLIGLIEGLELPYEPLMFAHPLFVSAAEPEGFAMLPELPPERGPLVLGVYRAVLAWARGPRVALATLTPERMDPWEREALVEAYVCAQKDVPDTELVVHLAVILTELRRPEDADSDEVALRCLNVSDWALEKGMRETAMAFAELAAIAWPGHCRYAWIAGKVYRSFGRIREAEFWLLRANRLAVWYKDWELQAMSLNSLGNLYQMQGSFDVANELLIKTLRIASRYKLADRKGRVLHDLFVIAAERSDVDRAEKYATSAYEAYGPEHENVLKLAHDVAQFWLEQGYFSRALQVFRALLPYFDQPTDRLRMLASTARAVGACKEMELFEHLWMEAWSLISSLQDSPVLAAALTELGLGASSLSQWDHAAQALSQAIETSRARNQADITIRAEVALAFVSKQEIAERDLFRRRGTPPLRAADSLAASLAESLDNRRGKDHALEGT